MNFFCLISRPIKADEKGKEKGSELSRSLSRVVVGVSTSHLSRVNTDETRHEESSPLEISRDVPVVVVVVAAVVINTTQITSAVTSFRDRSREGGGLKEAEAGEHKKREARVSL